MTMTAGELRGGRVGTITVHAVRRFEESTVRCVGWGSLEKTARWHVVCMVAMVTEGVEPQECATVRKAMPEQMPALAPHVPLARMVMSQRCQHTGHALRLPALS